MKEKMTAIIASPKDLTATPEDWSTVPQGVREKVVFMLLSGEFPTDGEIARKAGVRPAYITHILKNDPELARLRKEAEFEMAQRLEKSAVQLALEGRNEIAREKAHEFLLKKLYADKYSDDVAPVGNGKGSRKVVINLKLPEIAVDENGIPIAKSKNPLQEAIDV